MNANMYCNRNSFHRFGDDLCQHLLSYLQISDCFRYECVSKQWKRLIFNKQNKLIINRFGKDVFRVENRILELRENKYRINTTRFICVLQKCKFISDLNISSGINVEIIDLVTKNCQHLKSIQCYFKVISNKSLVLFATKFEQTLEIIKIRCDEYVFKMLIHLMPNLRKVWFTPLVDDNIELNLKSLYVGSDGRQLLPKLEEIGLSEPFYLNGFESFADTYCNHIKRLIVEFEYQKRLGNEKQLMDNFLTQLTRFENLEKLDLDLNNFEPKLIDEKLFTLIGIKCTKLIELRIDGYNEPNTTNLSNCFNRFVSLRNLKLNNIPLDGGVQCLKHCTHLTHLTLGIDNSIDSSFTAIDSCLPKLKHLRIVSVDTNVRITDNALRCLSKLKHLRYLIIDKSPDYIRQYNENITDNGVSDVIDNCVSIENIELRIITKVTQKSLNAFIKRAQQSPKTEFTFFVHFNKDIGVIVRDLPNNLCLKIIT